MCYLLCQQIIFKGNFLFLFYGMLLRFVLSLKMLVLCGSRGGTVADIWKTLRWVRVSHSPQSTAKTTLFSRTALKWSSCDEPSRACSSSCAGPRDLSMCIDYYLLQSCGSTFKALWRATFIIHSTSSGHSALLWLQVTPQRSRRWIIYVGCRSVSPFSRDEQRWPLPFGRAPALSDTRTGKRVQII